MALLHHTPGISMKDYVKRESLAIASRDKYFFRVIQDATTRGRKEFYTSFGTVEHNENVPQTSQVWPRTGARGASS